MSTSDRSAALESLAGLLRSLPSLSEVHREQAGPLPCLRCRLAEPIFGRELWFAVMPHEGGGLEFVLPDLMNVPLEESFAGVFPHLVVVNGVLVGRAVLGKDGRLHYSLTGIGDDEAGARELGALVELLRTEARQLQRLLMSATCGVLLPISAQMAMAMVRAVDETASSGGELEELPRIAI